MHKSLILLVIFAFFFSCKNNQCDEEICNEVIMEMISQTYDGKLYVDGIVNGSFAKCDTLNTTVELTINSSDADLLSISLLSDPPQIDTVINTYKVKCNVADCDYSRMRIEDPGFEDYIGGFYYRESDSIRISFRRLYSICDTFPGLWKEYDFFGSAN